MSIDWRQTLRKDGLANGWEWGGIKEFVTKKILPVKGWRHQDLSTLENHFHAMISVDPEVRYSFLRQSAKVGKFLLYVDISYECHLLSLDLAGKQLIEGIFCKINRTRRPFYTISYVSSRKTTQKWFSEMSFSVEPPQQDHPTLWYLSNLSGKFQTSYFLYILNRSVSGISLWPLKLIPIECQSNIICCI